jgi:hypothetical protein
MIKLVHIINPVSSEPGSRFHFVQQVTLESLRVAIRNLEDIQIELLSAQYPEDREMLTPIFTPTADLTRSVLDIARFQINRKLPILQDILDRAFQGSQAEYVIYTNIDIGLQPDFYQAVKDFILQGYDAFVINRRTVSDQYNSVTQLNDIYQDEGKPHRGWDCFIFPRSWIPELDLGTVCIGTPLVGLALLSNLIAREENFKEFKNKRLTFHLGDDKTWNRKKLEDYYQHNYSQLMTQLEKMVDRYGPFPDGTIPARFLAWQTHPVKARIYRIYSRHPLPLGVANLLKKERNTYDG